MIEDFTDYDEVKPSDCMTTGLIDFNHITADKIDGSKIACSSINHLYASINRLQGIYFIDSNGNEWAIEEMEDGSPILVPVKEAETDWREG